MQTELHGGEAAVREVGQKVSVIEAEGDGGMDKGNDKTEKQERDNAYSDPKENPTSVGK